VTRGIRLIIVLQLEVVSAKDRMRSEMADAIPVEEPPRCADEDGDHDETVTALTVQCAV